MTTTSMPASRAAWTVSIAVMPQSQVMIERGTGPLGRLESGGTEVVPVAKPVRHEREHIGPGDSQRPGQQGGRTLSVHVVVAMHQNPAAASNRSNDGRHGLCHSGERVGIGQVVQRRTQKAASGGFGAVASLDQKGCERGWKIECSGERVNRGRIWLGHDDPSQHRRGKDAHHANLPVR